MRDIDARRLSPARRLEVLARDFETCMYCLEAAEEVDHIIPWSFKHDDSLENLVAACWLCNHIASNLMFDDFDSKKQFIVRKKNKILKKNVIAIWTEDQLKEMGRKMKSDIRSNCVIAESEKDAKRIMTRIKSVGLEARYDF